MPQIYLIIKKLIVNVDFYLITTRTSFPCIACFHFLYNYIEKAMYFPHD